ncbi:MAG: PQQ-dependent sugar dehydrogenase [Nitrospirota bacterium]
MRLKPILFAAILLLIAHYSFAADIADKLKYIKLPPGFHISIYSDKVPGARSIALGDKGTVFIGTRGSKVYALIDPDKNGKAKAVYVIADNLDTPNGVAFRDGSLYVAEISRILRFDNIEDHLKNPPKPVVVYDKYPDKTHHGWKFIRFGPDGYLYVPIGAPCNICDPGDPFASITRLKPDGSGFEIFARGVRNTVGFDWDPVTKELWFTDNGRDWMGDELPPDELNHAPRPGMHFGFPYWHGKNISDPEFGKGHKASEFTPPELEFPAHVASLGIRFYTGDMFPAKYKDGIFVAEHGSWNRSTKIGYRVEFVPMTKDRKPVKHEVFAEGWLQSQDPWGRPVDVQVMPDGALLVSDDYAGAVYKITYKK